MWHSNLYGSHFLLMSNVILNIFKKHTSQLDRNNLCVTASGTCSFCKRIWSRSKLDRQSEFHLMRMFWSCKLTKLFFFNDALLVLLTPQQSFIASHFPAGIDCGDPQCYSLQEPNSYNFEILPWSFGNKRGEIVVHSIESRIFNRNLWYGWVTRRILCDQIQGTGLFCRRWLSWTGLINCAHSEVPQDAATALFSEENKSVAILPPQRPFDVFISMSSSSKYSLSPRFFLTKCICRSPIFSTVLHSPSLSFCFSSSP